jgi:glycosyltransferase involved in cell wall biosynthesis
LQNLATQLGVSDRIVYAGDVDDVKAAYAALDISVLPSALPEPFGGVVVESMAFSKPVVGTRIGGTVEQIEDGVTGFLVEPDNPEKLAEALEKLLRSGQLRLRMGENGHSRFINLFEFENFYGRILLLYSELIKDGGKE